jgi:CheY-like chemotaxis protein
MTKLMLVEDDNNLREIYEARLQAEGYTIVSARDGEEALVVAKAEKPELIIADVMMPKISGFEMLDILRNTEGLKEVKVIMLTALGQTDDQQRASRLGADRYLVKSQVTLEDIVKVAHELLGDSGNAAGGDTPPADAPKPATDPAPPSPDPTPAPPTDSPAAPADPAHSSDSPAQSTAQEEAAVEAKIEDFVAGASESPGAPEGTAPAATPVPTSQEKAETAATLSTPDPAAVAVNDKLVNDAAEALEVGAETVTKVEVKAESDETAETEIKPEPKKVGGERVIQPISSEPKKDLDTLLAIEEAKNVGSQPAEEPKAVVSDVTESPTPSAAKGNGPAASTPEAKVDPNSIAL